MSVFDELVGQDAAIRQLSRAASGEPGAMTHAWLITGPPGSGRSNAARAFAAALLTPDHGEDPSDAANRALRGTHESMTVLSTRKSIIGIGEVRELVSGAQSSPVNAPWRVIIIEDADRMVERTSNVLLKAIEEPPEATVWILCAPSPADVLMTIRSRCRNVNLRIPPTEAVAELLTRRDGVDPETALWAAAAAQNHIGRAKYLATNPEAVERRREMLAIPGRLTSLGNCVRLAQEVVDSATEHAKESSAAKDAEEKAALLATLGVEPGARIPPSVRSQVKRLEDDQKRQNVRARNDELDAMFLELVSLYRDVLAHQVGATSGWINRSETALVTRMSEGSGPADTLKRIEVITRARARLQTNTAPLLIVEAAFIGMSNPWLSLEETSVTSF